MRSTIVVIFIMLLGPALVGAETPLNVRKPAISPDGNTICFSCRGDLWTVDSTGGVAARLTVQPGYDGNPMFSPDGKWIAFTSQREGNYDVYTIPVEGGKASRLTWFNTSDWVTAWSPDSRWIYFYSWGRDESQHDIFRVSINGSTPEQITSTQGRYGYPSPDGEELIYYRYGDQATRKGYHGSNNGDLWRIDIKGTHHQITDYDGEDVYPKWIDKNMVYFLSDRDGIFNIWTIDLQTKELKQLTFHKKDGIEFFDVARTGNTIVYSFNFGLWTVLKDGGEPTRIPVTVKSDVSQDPVTLLIANENPQNPMLSPDGKRFAFSVQGELVIINSDPEKSTGDYRRLTFTEARDYRPIWSPNGEMLAYISDQDGNRNIWTISHLGHDQKQLTFFKNSDVIDIEWSPDGKWLVFQDTSENLYLIPSKGGDHRLLVKGPEVYTPEWSPDSRWIAYEKHNEKSMGTIYAISVDGGEPVNLSQKRSGHDMIPIWLPDGKRMLFLSDRDEQWNIYMLRLTDDPDPDDPAEKKKDNAWENIELDGDKSKKKTEDTPDNDKTEKPVNIKFNLDRIDERVRKITSLPRGTLNFNLSPDGKTIVYLTSKEAEGGSDVWTISLSGEDEKQHTTGVNADTANNAPNDNQSFYDQAVFWDTTSKLVYFRSGGQLKQVNVNSGDTKTISFSVPLEYNRIARFKQMYREAWRGLRDYFYDENMHGLDWPQIYNKYLPMIESIETVDEFNDILGEMYGELNASHLGIWQTDRDPVRATGCLGVTVEPTDSGFFRVTDVEKDSPADDELPSNRINKGDYIISVNNITVKTDDNFFRLLNGTANVRTEITVNNKPASEGARTVRMVPLGLWQYMRLRYENEIEARRELVKKLSEDRLGYHHIRMMDQSSLEKFKRDLFYEVDIYDGLVLDVRENGGGHIHDQLMDILERVPYMYSQNRHNIKELQPHEMWAKPVVLLINQNSFSDAEIFPFIFRFREIGKIVGLPTFGGVIGTSEITLIDGTQFRLPMSGWYSLDGENLENYGVPPDIEIDNDPNSLMEGRDVQLEKAIELLLSQLDNQM